MRVAIANRGEVAVRIIRACQELGYRSILLHSKVDETSLAARLADECIAIPGATPRESYLDVEVIVTAACQAKAKFLHPGYGFLSENADLAEAAKRAKLLLVGPSAAVIKRLGDKIKARKIAQAANVPVIPAYVGSATDEKKLAAEAKQIGFPIVIKAVAGGGGKGMRIVHSKETFADELTAAKREAEASFADGTIYLEKYLKRPRHIEVQIAADQQGQVLHFFERECSIQRRFQKIVEESPSPTLGRSNLSDKITQAAVRVAKKAGYRNTGTVEFLIDGSGNFYFLEFNTRLQVEHAVTEMVCGIDLVKLQFYLAQGKKLPWRQKEIKSRGHALEARVYAEDPTQQFLPSTGPFAALELALGPHRRFDFGYEQGDKMTEYFDAMIGKVVTWAPTRAENLSRMYATLSETIVFGLETNIEFLKSIMLNKTFRLGKTSTHFLTEEYANAFSPPNLTEEQLEFAKKAMSQTSLSGSGRKSSLAYQSPWQMSS